MFEWVSVKDKLPEIDEYVLWWHESGNVFQEAIDKDWDREYLDYFLGGYGNKETSGPLTHWTKISGPINA
jgi:hypothetical protein